MLLLINACVRSNSRTKKLADCLLEKLGLPFTEVCLKNVDFPVADENFLQHRDKLIETEQFDDPLFALARQFAEADYIVVAAPYWDLSFPASLKQYFEQINVLGITFKYTPEGTPEPMCRAKKLFYITTAGGAFLPEEFGFGYVKALAQNFYRIQDVEMFLTSGLDIEGLDVEQIMRESKEKITAIAERMKEEMTE